MAKHIDGNDLSVLPGTWKGKAVRDKAGREGMIVGDFAGGLGSRDLHIRFNDGTEHWITLGPGRHDKPDPLEVARLIGKEWACISTPRCETCGGSGRCMKQGPIAFGARLWRICRTCKGAGLIHKSLKF